MTDRRPLRVMIADDSAVVRGLVSRWLAERPEFEVVAIAGDGGQAVKRAGEIDADLCVLDVEMPVLSGLEALPKILALRPQMKVIMCSTLTHQGASVTLKALDLGAWEIPIRARALEHNIPGIHGVGESLTLHFGRERSLVGFEIINGYDKDQKIWSANSRVDEIEATTGDGQVQVITLKDVRGASRFDFDAPVERSL